MRATSHKNDVILAGDFNAAHVDLTISPNPDNLFPAS